MLFAEKDIQSRGFRQVTLNVSRDNPDAKRLYEHLGYRIVADEPGIWSYIDHEGQTRHVNEPSWRMEKNLKNDYLEQQLEVKNKVRLVSFEE